MPDDEDKKEEEAAEDTSVEEDTSAENNTEEEETADSDDADKEDSEKEDSDDSAEDNDAESKDEEDAEDEKEAAKPFSSLDGKEVYVFGWEPNPKARCWYDLSLQAKTYGYTADLMQKIERSLQQNVDACYFQLASLYFVDLEDEMRYHAYFDNMKGLWKLEVTDSPDAPIEIQQMGDFFGSDIMKRAAKRCYDVIIRAAREFESGLRPEFEDGKLLAVDEVKLAAELEVINRDVIMQNLRTCKWMST